MSEIGDYKPGRAVYFRYLKDEKREVWYYGLCIGVEGSEVMVLDDHMQEYRKTLDRVMLVPARDIPEDGKGGSLTGLRKVALLLEKLSITS